MFGCCCGSTVARCETRTHKTQMSVDYFVQRGRCGVYLRIDRRWWREFTPEIINNQFTEFAKPPAFGVVGNSGTQPPAISFALSILEERDGFIKYRYNPTTGGPHIVEETLSKPLTKEEVKAALNSLQNSFNTQNLLEVGHWKTTNNQDGTASTVKLTQAEFFSLQYSTGVRLTLPSAGFWLQMGFNTGSPAPAYDIRETQAAIKWQARLETTVPWCLYYTGDTGTTSCFAVQLTPRRGGTPLKTYYPTGQIVPLIGQQENAPQENHIVELCCPPSNCRGIFGTDCGP